MASRVSQVVNMVALVANTVSLAVSKGALVVSTVSLAEKYSGTDGTLHYTGSLPVRRTSTHCGKSGGMARENVVNIFLPTICQTTMEHGTPAVYVFKYSDFLRMSSHCK